MIMVPLAITLHVLAAVIWVGGMFFAYLALRPSLADLSPADRLGTWNKVFARFFRWVWLTIAALWGSGLWLILDVYGGMAVAGLHIHVMMGIAAVMTLLFAFLYFVRYRSYQATLAAGDLPATAATLNKIRHIFAANLAMGLINVVIGGIGGYLG